MKEIDKLKKDYDAIEIPSELEDIVHHSIDQAKASPKKKSMLKQWSIGTAAAAALFIGSINISPTMAQSLSNIPGLSAIVEVFTVQKMALDDETYQANLDTPAIEGLENEELQASLNQKYIDENRARFKQFEQEVAEMKEVGEGHLGIDAGYEVMTDTDQLLSIARYEVNTVASSSTTMKYDTIDKQENLLITLPSLFKDEQYIEVISSYIYGEMEKQMASDKEVSYFIKNEFEGTFEGIHPEQNFYITDNHKLVISFDKYEIAPGYMGIVTFEIPSNILENLLVSDRYIQ